MGIFVRATDDDLPERDSRVIPFMKPRAMTASAQRVRLNDKDDVEKLQRRGRTAWQARSWEYFDAIGEISYAFEMKAGVVSRARLFPAFVVDPHQPPVQLRDVGKAMAEEEGDTSEDAPTIDPAMDPADETDPDILNDPATQLAPPAPNELRSRVPQTLPEDFIDACETAMARILSTKGGMPGMLRDMALNFDVAGECYLVQSPARIGSREDESWDIKSVDELTVRGDGKAVIRPTRDAREKDHEILPANAFVGRMWRSHPRFSGEAHSSMRGVLEACADLLLFGRANRAAARSRLNAGALYIPDGLSASARPEYPELAEDENLPPEEDHDEFEEELILAMTTPIADEESASAVVPLIIRGPEELGDKIKLIKFERQFDQILAERADRSLERIMQGIDVPKELVTGLANVKYSNAVVINLNLYKAHIEPLLLLIVDALTFTWLRPALRAMGFKNDLVDKATVWYDPTDIIVQGDREAMADLGYDKNLVGEEAWRRAHGFTEADKPTPDELVMKKVLLSGQVTPELTEAFLRQLAPHLWAAMRDQHAAAGGTPLPPEVSQALGVPPSEAGTPPQAPATPPTAPPASPAPPGAPAGPPGPAVPGLEAPA